MTKEQDHEARKRSPDAEGTPKFPKPGPAPVGPAVTVKDQTPVATPPEPEKAPPGPALGSPKK